MKLSRIITTTLVLVLSGCALRGNSSEQTNKTAPKIHVVPAEPSKPLPNPAPEKPAAPVIPDSVTRVDLSGPGKVCESHSDNEGKLVIVCIPADGN